MNKKFGFLLILCLSALFIWTACQVPVQEGGAQEPPFSVSSIETRPPAAIPTATQPPSQAETTPTATQKPTAAPTEQLILPQANELHGGFELPVNGATGYASRTLTTKKGKDSQKAGAKLSPGDAFTILAEEDGWLKIDFQGKVGWISGSYCMINLPDVLPSAIYNNTNSDKSIFMSSGYKLPGVTGKALYQTYGENPRLGREEYVMPVLYPVAKKICAAQEQALSQGYSIVVYELFRPRAAQRKVAQALEDLAAKNKKVQKGLNADGWTSRSFIAHNLSMHQKGLAMDISLAAVESCEEIQCGDYTYLRPKEWEESQMPTAMHELSIRAVSYERPFSSKKKTGWEKIPLAQGMTESAILLREICTSSGLVPLASEWWHFNDLDAAELVGDKYSVGDFSIKSCLSQVPR